MDGATPEGRPPRPSGAPSSTRPGAAADPAAAPARSGVSLRAILIPGPANVREPFGEWAGGLILVAAGRLELVWESGASRSFGPGSMIVLVGVGVRAIRPCGGRAVRLLVVHRAAQREDEAP